MKRAERFGLSHQDIEEAKKASRAERFGIVASEEPEGKAEGKAAKKVPIKAAGAGSGGAKAATQVFSAEFEARKKVRPGEILPFAPAYSNTGGDCSPAEC